MRAAVKSRACMNTHMWDCMWDCHESVLRGQSPAISRALRPEVQLPRRGAAEHPSSARGSPCTASQNSFSEKDRAAFQTMGALPYNV
jgi:hypothetical protein